MQPVQLTHMHKVFSDMHCCMFYYNYMRSWRLYSPIFYTKSEVVQKLIDTYRTQHLKKVKKKWNFSMSFCLFALRKWLSLETCLKRRTQKWVTFFDNSTSKNVEKNAKYLLLAALAANTLQFFQHFLTYSKIVLLKLLLVFALYHIQRALF